MGLRREMEVSRLKYRQEYETTKTKKTTKKKNSPCPAPWTVKNPKGTFLNFVKYPDIAPST